MSPKRFFRRLLKYLILTTPLAIGMFLIVSWSLRKAHDSPGYIARHTFPSEKVFIDLDKVRVAKKAHQVDSVFQYLQKKIGFNGNVLYAEKGRLVYQASFGYSDYDTREKLTTQSAFQLASVSKMFTAMAIMILAEEGQISFDDSLKYFFPDLPYPGVTIRHLLVHRSGIPNYMYLADDYWNRDLSMCNDDIIRMLEEEKQSRYFRADNGFHYCNTNYALLASIVEKVAGQSFELYAKYNIFDPLEMNSTFVYRLPEDSPAKGKIDAQVCGHAVRRRRLVTQPDYYQNGIVGDKGVYSTIGDLFKFDQALYHEKLVSDSTLALAFTPGSPRFSRHRDNYGFGWRIKADRDNTVYHFGWWKGFRSYFIRDLDQEKTIIILTNADRGPSSDYYWDILDNHQYDLGPVSSFPMDKGR